jgi:hypothetical protein
MREVDYRLLNQVCRTHAVVLLNIFGQMLSMGIPIGAIKVEFLNPNDDEYITYEEQGYKLEKTWDGDGKVTVQACPGEFVQMSFGKRWVNRITRFHSVIGNNGQREKESMQ